MSDGLNLISAAIRVGSASSLVSMPAEMFLDDELTAYSFVTDHYRRYQELPTAATLREETNIRLPAAPESLSYYEDQLYHRTAYNHIRLQFGTLREALATRDVAQAVSIARSIATVQVSSARDGMHRMDSALGEVLSRIERARGYGGIPGIPVGWPTFDYETGGLQQGDVVSLVARMGMGKTYTAMKMVDAAHLDGANVLVVTTEMTSEQIARRKVAIRLGINPRALKTGMVSNQVMQRIREMARDVEQWERYHVYTVGMDSRTSVVSEAIDEVSPDVVLIDGLYLLKPSVSTRQTNRTESFTAVLDEVKGIALARAKPILATTQLNRQAGSKGANASLETISYADAVGTHSSVVLAVQDGTTEDPTQSRLMQFLKGREGEAGNFLVNFKFSPFDMEEIAQEPDGPQQQLAAGGEIPESEY